MNDPRIDKLLLSLRRDLSEIFASRAVDERIREFHSHLDEAVGQAIFEGAVDPVATALADFGAADGYRLASVTAGNGVLRRGSERLALRWAAATLLIPIGADLTMDFSSWLTGSDSALYAVGIPVTLYLGVRFGIASTNVRRLLVLPVAGLTLGSFALYSVLGGWARATNNDRMGSQPRGTAFRRREGLLHDTLPAKQALAKNLRRSASVFASVQPTPTVGEFRVAEGYLIPEIPESWRNDGKGDPRAYRWLIDGLGYKTLPDYAAAHRWWQTGGPSMIRLADLGVRGEQQEIDELARVVDCPWSRSALAQLDEKAAMGLLSGVCLLAVHTLGIAGGWIARRRRRRGVA